MRAWVVAFAIGMGLAACGAPEASAPAVESEAAAVTTCGGFHQDCCTSGRACTGVFRCDEGICKVCVDHPDQDPTCS